MSVPDYFDRVNPDLLALIPPDAKVVLEIGCGAGALCEAYRRINPGVAWYGVEPDFDARVEGNRPGRCNYVHGGPVESCDFDDGDFPEDPVDVLVLGDVLEHLHDPWSQLHRLTRLIKPGALILACIPNIGHWTVIRDLMAGKWTYTDEGLMDRTHLRFFTLESIVATFQDAGLQIDSIMGRDICNEGLEDWISESGIPYTNQIRAYQYVVRAVKPDVRLYGGHAGPGMSRGALDGQPFAHATIQHLHIHAITDGTVCERPRIHEPFAALRTIPGASTSWCKLEESCDPLTQYVPADIDSILILQRFQGWGGRLDDSLRDLFEQRHRCVVVAEWDDNPECFPALPAVDFAPLRNVHAVQCSTEPLAEVCRRYNPNVMVFENQIAELGPLKEQTGRDSIHIFYGALNREADWAPIMPALNRVIDGRHSKLWFSVVHDKAFYDALDTMHKSFTPFCDYDQYRSLLRACDIALLPLEPSEFNACKSDIKFLEGAAEGVAVLASETVYGDTFQVFNPTLPLVAMTYHATNPFKLALERLIRDVELRRHMTSNAYAYVCNHRMLGQHFRKRYQWYVSLIRQREDLHASLLERAPAYQALPTR